MPDRHPTGAALGGHEYVLSPFAAALSDVDPLAGHELQRSPVGNLMRALGDDAGHATILAERCAARRASAAAGERVAGGVHRDALVSVRAVDREQRRGAA